MVLTSFMKNSFLNRARVFALSIALILPLLSVASLAATITTSEFLKSQRVTVEALKNDLKAANERLVSSDTDDQTLAKLRVDLQQLIKQILDEGIALRAPLNQANLRLDQLGLSDEGAKEVKAIADERAALKKQKTDVNTLAAQLEDSYISANRLLIETVTKSRELFARALTHRVKFDPSLGKDIEQGGHEAFSDLMTVIASWWQHVIEFKFWHFMASIIVPLAIVVIFGCVSWYFSKRRKVELTNDVDQVSYLSRLVTALISALLPLIGFSLFFGLTLGLMSFFGVLSEDVAIIFRSLSGALVLILFIAFMASAIFSPNNPQLRLIDTDAKSGRLLVMLLTALATVVSFDHLLRTVYRVVEAPISLTIIKSFVTVFLVGILILAIAFIKPRRDKETGESRGWPTSVKIILILLGIVPVIFAFAGYIGLARYLTQQIVVSGAFLVLLYIGLQTGRALANEGAFANTYFGKMLANRFNFDPMRMDQFGLFIGIILNICVVIVCVPAIAMQIGFSGDEIFAGFIHLFTGFQIGNVSISLVAILTGLLFFIVSFFIVRWFVNWLDGTVLARGKVDSGVRNSIRTVVGYIGLAIAALIGLSAAGFNLASLAIVAGGLSLGIGFGLQNIVQNFVSGLILLAERPFKVGDYIETGSIVGTVKRISVRATEVETTKRQTIIVPNSSLINNNVGNWTLRNRIGRVDIPITVPAIVDPKHVYDMLMAIAEETAGVLKNPAPYVSFSAFDSNIFTFTLCVYYPDIVSTTATTNALRFAIYQRFSDEGISG